MIQQWCNTLYFNSLAWKQLPILKSQFLETELIWVIHRSHRAYDWRDIISSEDSTLVRMTTNKYMLSLCMKCISFELFHTKSSSSFFPNCDLLPLYTMDTKHQANNLLYSKHKKDIFSRTQRILFPVWIRRNHKTFFFPLENQDTNVPSFSLASYYFLTARTEKLNYAPLRLFCNILAWQG